jgi:hypothetical protein
LLTTLDCWLHFLSYYPSTLAISTHVHWIINELKYLFHEIKYS